MLCENTLKKVAFKYQKHNFSPFRRICPCPTSRTSLLFRKELKIHNKNVFEATTRHVSRFADGLKGVSSSGRSPELVQARQQRGRRLRGRSSGLETETRVVDLLQDFDFRRVENGLPKNFLHRKQEMTLGCERNPSDVG